MLIHDDDDGAVASRSIEGDGCRPGPSEVHILITTLGGNLDRGGVLCSVGADSGLNIGDGHIGTANILLGQRMESQGQGLAVDAVVAVAGRTVLAGDGLTDGAQVVLQVHLDELKDSLTDASLGGVEHTGWNGWSTTGIGFAVESVIRDTIDGT